MKYTNEQWQMVFTIFCHDCFMSWKREGLSTAKAFEKARMETLSLKHDPFSPKGQEVDTQALSQWEKLYNQQTVDLLYAYEHKNAINELRVCSNCGFPIFYGYYISGSFFCCDKCAVDGAYNGNEERFTKDLEHGDDPRDLMWDEVYWSQWHYPINE